MTNYNNEYREFMNRQQVIKDKKNSKRIFSRKKEIGIALITLAILLPLFIFVI